MVGHCHWCCPPSSSLEVPCPLLKWLSVPRNLFSSEEAELQPELSQTLGNISSWLSPLLRTPGQQANSGPGRWASEVPSGPWVGRWHTGGLPGCVLPFGEEAGRLQSTEESQRLRFQPTGAAPCHPASPSSACNFPCTGRFPSGPAENPTATASAPHSPRLLLPSRSDLHTYSLERTLPSCATQPPPAPAAPGLAPLHHPPWGGRSGRGKVGSLLGALCPVPGTPGPRPGDGDGEGSEGVGGDAAMRLGRARTQGGGKRTLRMHKGRVRRRCT